MCTILWNSSRNFLYLCNENVQILFENVTTPQNATDNTISNTSQIIEYPNITNFTSPLMNLSSPSSSLSSPSSSFSTPSSSFSTPSSKSTLTETNVVVSVVNFINNSTNSTNSTDNNTPNLRGNIPGPNLHLLHLLWLILPIILVGMLFIYKRKQNKATICPVTEDKYTTKNKPVKPPISLATVAKIAKPHSLNTSQMSSSTEETIVYSPRPPLPTTKLPDKQKNLPDLPSKTEDANIDNIEKRKPTIVVKRGNSLIIYRGKKKGNVPQRSKSLPTKHDN